MFDGLLGRLKAAVASWQDSQSSPELSAKFKASQAAAEGPEAAAHRKAMNAKAAKGDYAGAVGEAVKFNLERFNFMVEHPRESFKPESDTAKKLSESLNQFHEKPRETVKGAVDASFDQIESFNVMGKKLLAAARGRSV